MIAGKKVLTIVTSNVKYILVKRSKPVERFDFRINSTTRALKSLWMECKH